MLGECVITGEECPTTKMPEQPLSVLQSPVSTTLTSPPPSKKLKQARLPFKILDPKAIVEPKLVTTPASGKKRKPADTATSHKAAKIPKSGNARDEDAENEVSSSSEADLAPKYFDQKTGKPRGLERFVQSTQQLVVSTSCEDVIDLVSSNDESEDAKPTESVAASAKTPSKSSEENPEPSKEPKTDTNELQCQDETNDTKEPVLVKTTQQEISCVSSEEKNEDNSDLNKAEDEAEVSGMDQDASLKDGADTKPEACENSLSRDSAADTSVISLSTAASDYSDGGDSDRKESPAVGSSVALETPPTPSTPGGRLVKKPPLSASKTKQKEEERRKKQEEREKAKEEKLRQKDLEKQKKEQQRLEKEKERKEKKEQERLQREKERQEKLADKEKEKEEKMRQKEEERKKKQEAIDAKLEEKRKKEEEKEEEKKKKEEERLKVDMMKNKKIQQSQSLFKNFFKKVEPTEPVKTTEKVGPFSAFHVLLNMKMAPRVRASIATPRLEQLDQQMEAQSATKLYMDLLRSGEAIPGVSGKTWPYDNDLIILEDGPATEAPPRMRTKLFKFHENYRPAYFGTWRKRSKAISARNPFKKDEVLLDYEVDSDDEWEEEEPGESLSNSEGEGEADGEETKEDDNDGFFVPHGYLSDGEGCEDDEEDGNPEKMKMRQIIKAKVFEAELKKRTEVLQMILVGCRWCQPGDEPDPQLGQYSVSFLVDETPIMIGSDETGSANRPKTKKEKVVKDPKESQSVPDEAMSHLIRLVHGNIASIKKLICEFQAFWSRTQRGTKSDELDVTCDDNSDGISEKKETAPDLTDSKKADGTDIDEPESASSISKRQLEFKVRAIATYEKRESYPVKCWYVSRDVLEKHGLAELPVPTEWKWITPGPKQRPPKPTAEGTPTTKKAAKDTSSPAPTNHSIKQFAVPGLIHANIPEVAKPTTPKSKLFTAKAGTPSPQVIAGKKGQKKISGKPITLFCAKKSSVDSALKEQDAALVVSQPFESLPAEEGGGVAGDDNCMVVESTLPAKKEATAAKPGTASPRVNASKKGLKFSAKPITKFCSNKGGAIASQPVLSLPVRKDSGGNNDCIMVDGDDDDDDDDDCMIVDEQFVPPPPSKSQPTLLSMLSVKTQPSGS